MFRPDAPLLRHRYSAGSTADASGAGWKHDKQIKEGAKNRKIAQDRTTSCLTHLQFDYWQMVVKLPKCAIDP